VGRSPREAGCREPGKGPDAECVGQRRGEVERRTALWTFDRLRRRTRLWCGCPAPLPRRTRQTRPRRGTGGAVSRALQRSSATPDSRTAPGKTTRRRVRGQRSASARAQTYANWTFRPNLRYPCRDLPKGSGCPVDGDKRVPPRNRPLGHGEGDNYRALPQIDFCRGRESGPTRRRRATPTWSAAWRFRG
jgi:hypothetical protein